MKILLVSLLNERSGSVFALKNLQEYLISQQHTISVAAPKGEVLKENICFTEKKAYKGILKKRKIINSQLQHYDIVIINTIVSGLLFIKHKKVWIYFHEQPNSLQKKAMAIYKIENIFYKNKLSINPLMNNVKDGRKGAIYFPLIISDIGNNKKSILTISSMKKKDSDWDKKVCMIASFTRNKGVYRFIELARSFPEYSFTLLTQFISTREKKILGSLPDNLIIEENQLLKEIILKKSAWCLQLSSLNETFGFTNIEAIESGVVPLCFENIGAKYSLGKEAIFLDERKLHESFKEAVKILQNKYDEYLEQCIDTITSTIKTEKVREVLEKIKYISSV